MLRKMVLGVCFLDVLWPMALNLRDAHLVEVGGLVGLMDLGVWAILRIC